MSGYHHGNLRASLIEAGVELAKEGGPDGVVLREAARRTGVSPNAAYRHFANREDLVGAVGAVGLQRLASAMTRRLTRVREPDPAERARARLREVGRAYVEFALREPGLFAAAFAARPEPAEARDPGPFDILGQALDECLSSGVMRRDKRPGAEVTCWSAVHGFAMLHLTGPLAVSSRRDRDTALTALLARMEDGLTSPAGG